ncbi:hypothetical protein SH584_05855 [Sphingomonas sp. LY29]|uniref:hypothetical protein n=1 Tax=Sphingomonas sp. LY29 TaxID=3095341 RepID=UPI002D793AB8|nr:hypothetical protein [Sphingomonas sp. LY29]WRP26945.1 hypothetical protein SH584_05855 [Sphingomonas sp. LY29]
MAYRSKATFDQPSAEDIEQMRGMNAWFLPLLFFQQASLIFREGGSPFTAYLGIVAWAFLILVEFVYLSAWKVRWLGERENAILNDEWHRAISGEASRWGLAAVATLGVGMIVADRWITFDGPKLIFILVNGGMLTAGLRYAWLNRGVADDDA